MCRPVSVFSCTIFAMPSPRNHEPFHELFLVKYATGKRCKGCDRTLPLTLSNWYGRNLAQMVPVWGDSEIGHREIGEERQIVRAPSSRCRSCTNEAKGNRRLLEKVLADFTPEQLLKERAQQSGVCETCRRRAKQRSTFAFEGGLMIVCSQCRKSLAESYREAPDSPTRYARDQWKIMFDHCADEVRIEREVLARTNLDRVPPHRYNKSAANIRFNHSICKWLEISWRGVYRWLKEHEGEGA
jgi:hypothetical protein